MNLDIWSELKGGEKMKLDAMSESKVGGKYIWISGQKQREETNKLG